MRELPPHLQKLGRDLEIAVTRLVADRRRRTRRLRIAGATAAFALACSTAAIASGIGPGLELDPTKWSLLGGGKVDDGRGEYVHAKRVDDGSNSTFMVEHDQGLDRYEAFLLHERLREAAAETSPVPVRREEGKICTRAELTRAERIALETLRASHPPGAPAEAGQAEVDDAIRAAFEGAECRGLEYASEIARHVYSGLEPQTNLMPGAE